MKKPLQFDVCKIPFGVQFTLLVVCLLSGRIAFTQALPAAEAAPISTGFALPTTLGSLQYALSASQSLNWGYYGNSGVWAMTNLSGDLAYLSNSKRHPFSTVLSGGRSFSESGQASYSFASVGVSQVASFGRWSIVLSDSVSYLPGTPVGGLSGVPGVGDLGITPVQVGTDTGQGVLTNYSSRISNLAAVTLSRQLTGKTSLNASGTDSISKFINTNLNSGNASSGAGLDSDSASGGGGINHQLNARTSFGGNYSYSSSQYPGNSLGVATPSFSSQTVSGFVSHQFSRKLSGNMSAGPEWSKVSVGGAPLSVSLFVSASGGYSAKNYSTSLAFTRSTNSGFGVTGGALSNAVNFAVSKTFAVVWRTSASAAYTRTSNLPVPNVPLYSSNTYVTAIQISRAIARSLSCYASYTLQDQAYSAQSAVDVYSGLSQSASFGITYSPSALHLGRQ